jgi:hypothetical protein
MVRVDPGQARVQIVDTGGSLEITIPSKVKWFIAIFLSFWLVAWAVGAVTVATQLAVGKAQDSGAIFMVGWLGAWLAGGGAAMLFLLWMLFGREIVRIGAADIQYVRAIGPLSLKREYDIAHVKRLRVAPALAPVGYRVFGSNLPSGTIAFDYGASTKRFGFDLDEAEAQPVVDAVRRRFRHLGE